MRSCMAPAHRIIMATRATPVDRPPRARTSPEGRRQAAIPPIMDTPLAIIPREPPPVLIPPTWPTGAIPGWTRTATALAPWELAPITARAALAQIITTTPASATEQRALTTRISLAEPGRALTTSAMELRPTILDLEPRPIRTLRTWPTRLILEWTLTGMGRAP